MINAVILFIFSPVQHPVNQFLYHGVSLDITIIPMKIIAM